MLRFGPAGVPLQCGGSSLEGIKCTASLGMDAMEIEFVHGCRMKLESAKACGDEAKKLDVSLSAHASYYLNLLSPEKAKLEKTKRELVATAQVMDAAGGGRISFHPGFYLGMKPEEAYAKMKESLEDVLQRIRGLDATLAPEVMGKHSQFGTLEEVYCLAEDFGYDHVAPCVDWGHVHARSNGGLKKKEDFAKVLELIEKKVGKEGLKTLHCHVEGIDYTEKGERKHLPLEGAEPPYKLLLQVLKEYKCSGTLICESPLLEKDALLLKKVWRSCEGRG